ncbi:MAG: CPBP family intramembrane glutamic endopeptidase [Bilifractor sp.]
MNRGRKIWDVLYPFVSFLMLMILATVIVLILSVLVPAESGFWYMFLKASPLLINIIYYLWSLIYQRKQFRMDENRFGADAMSVSPAVLAASLLFTVSAGELISFLIYQSPIPDLFPAYDQAASVSFQGQNIVLLIIVTVVLAPLAEEEIFRGMTYRRARNYLGVNRAVVLSALLFGLYHMNMVQFLFATVLGLMLAALYERTRTLIVPVVCHAAVNAAQLVSARIPSSALSVIPHYRLWFCLAGIGIVALSGLALFRMKDN